MDNGTKFLFLNPTWTELFCWGERALCIEIGWYVNISLESKNKILAQLQLVLITAQVKSFEAAEYQLFCCCWVSKIYRPFSQPTGKKLQHCKVTSQSSKMEWCYMWDVDGLITNLNPPNALSLLLWYQIWWQIIFKREQAKLSSSLLNIIYRQIWYQSKSDYMDRAYPKIQQTKIAVTKI